MYTYYLVSAYRPELKENVEVKKFVTKVQMVSGTHLFEKNCKSVDLFQAQFLILMFFFGRPLLNPDCPIPKFFLFEIVFQNVILFSLFSNFYYKNYFCAKK